MSRAGPACPPACASVYPASAAPSVRSPSVPEDVSTEAPASDLTSALVFQAGRVRTAPYVSASRAIVKSFSQWETKIEVIKFEVDVQKTEGFHYWEFTSIHRCDSRRNRFDSKNTPIDCQL